MRTFWTVMAVVMWASVIILALVHDTLCIAAFAMMLVFLFKRETA